MNSKILEKQKALKVLNLIPQDFCQFFTHVLLLKSDTEVRGYDPQTPNAAAVMYHSIMLDTLLEYLWDTMEKITGEELLPTYAYARLYNNGDILEKHTDRKACEISVTIQLHRSHPYVWNINMGNEVFSLNPGDGVVYSGCDVEHWRDACNGPDGYYSGQIFLHYVRKNGKYVFHAGDSTTRMSPKFIKNRLN